MASRARGTATLFWRGVLFRLLAFPSSLLIIGATAFGTQTIRLTGIGLAIGVFLWLFVRGTMRTSNACYELAIHKGLGLFWPRVSWVAPGIAYLALWLSVESPILQRDQVATRIAALPKEALDLITEYVLRRVVSTDQDRRRLQELDPIQSSEWHRAIEPYLDDLERRHFDAYMIVGD